MRLHYLLIRCLFYSCLLSGCQSIEIKVPIAKPPDLQCSNLERDAIQALFEEESTLVTSNSLVFSEEPVDQSIIEVGGSDSIVIYSYNLSDKQITVDTRNGEPFIAIFIWAEKNTASVGLLLECIAPPTQYSVQYHVTDAGGVIANVTIAWEQLGVLWSDSIELSATEAKELLATHTVPFLNPETPVQLLNWMHPADLETLDARSMLQITESANSETEIKQLRQSYYSTFMPWPGDINKLVVTSMP
jgi:hypothetical protein